MAQREGGRLGGSGRGWEGSGVWEVGKRGGSRRYCENKEPPKRQQERKWSKPGEGGEQSLGHAGWSAPPRWRPRSASQTQIPSSRVNRACLFQGDCKAGTAASAPSLRQHFRVAGGGPLSPSPSEDRGKRPRGCPGPLWLGGQARARQLVARPPHPLPSRRRQRGGAGHLETKTS